ncbi:MAG: helix-turn-helix domain-containing protein, partial [Candidatus Wildermuthbacteria bacterium]|nr:helix-turn-helix domain-containing protein [Candidatus Wildermuthbacteria bacterium]
MKKSKLGKIVLRDRVETMKTLIVVESPTKAKTLGGFLGKEYNVQSSFGHVRDLPASTLGVDVEHDFEPTYVIPPKTRKTVTSLKKASKDAKEVILASVDYDEPALIQYPDGLVRMEKVGKFIDWLLDSSISPSQFRVAAFSSHSHRISFKRIKHAIRHSIKEKLLKIKTDYGRTITVTASHSLFQKGADETIKTVAGKNLKEGDSLLVPVSIPRGKKNLSGDRIDILKAIYENKELRNNVFIKSPSVAKYRRSQLLAPRNGDTPQFAPRILLTNGLRKKLQRYRFDKEWSQKALAKQIECSQSNISDWESGRGNPTLEPGQRYFNALGMKFDTLVAKRELAVGPSSIEQAVARALETQWRDSRKSKSRSWQPLSWFTWEELEQNFSGDGTIEVSRSNHSHCMPRFIPVDEDLMLFLGFFTAEGSFLTHGKYTRFSFGPKTHAAEGMNIKRVRELSQRLFNLTPSDFKEKTGHSVILNSTLVTFFLKEIMGIKRGAEHKEVPHLVFNVPRDLQFAFLKGCFLGDGTLGKGGIAFNTISTSLADGISYLFIQNRILSTHSLAISKKPNRKPLNQITITGKKKLIATLPIWGEHYKARKLKEYCKRNTNLKINFSLAKEQRGDLALLRIKKIEEVKPRGCYVYDFSVDGENFVCGNGGICAHNTDEDREGEAIAWHIAEVLGLKDPQRIVFHEITKGAIEEALKNPRTVDLRLVNAQQARRVLDRLVGYKLSPFLWKKVARGLSAGRVQSVAVRLVADREREIQSFKPQEYWTIVATFDEFEAILKQDVKNKEEAGKILKDLEGAEYRVEKIERKEVKRNPLPPFTTSTL